MDADVKPDGVAWQVLPNTVVTDPFASGRSCRERSDRALADHERPQGSVAVGLGLSEHFCVLP